MTPCMIVILASYLLLLLSYPETAISFRAKSHRITLLKNRQLANGDQQHRNTLRRKHTRNALQDNLRTTSFTLRSTTLIDEVDQSTSRASLKDLIRTPLHNDRKGIVIIAGFEAFNVQLYRKAAALVM
jgi:hypothetical protein